MTWTRKTDISGTARIHSKTHNLVEVKQLNTLISTELHNTTTTRWPFVRGIPTKSDENVRKSKLKSRFFYVFLGFSAPKPRRILKPNEEMILHYTRARETQIWPISSIFFVFFLTKLHIFHIFFNFLPLIWLPGVLGPFSKERSRFSASDGTPETSVRWNLTRLRTVQSSKFHVFVFFDLSMLYFTIGQMGSVILHGFFPHNHRLPICPMDIFHG